MEIISPNTIAIKKDRKGEKGKEEGKSRWMWKKRKRREGVTKEKNEVKRAVSIVSYF